MAIRNPDKHDKRGIQRADWTSTFERRIPVPAWGETGALVHSFYVHNNKESAILYARTTAEGVRSPNLDVETSVEMSMNDLDQFIGQLRVIGNDMVKWAAAENAREMVERVNRGEV